MAAGVLFPEREMIDVGVEVTAESCGFDAVRVAGRALGVDKLVVSGPLRAGFGFEEWDEKDE